MTDINKQIEEARNRYYTEVFNFFTEEEKIIAKAEFANGAFFILDKMRWRKVSEELPELGIEVIVTRNDGIRFLAWLDKDTELFFNVSGNEEYFLDEIQSWKPID